MVIIRLLILTLILSSCATGSTLRTARVLEKGEVEISGGVTGSAPYKVAGVGLIAYGLTDNVELEFRYEDEYFALTPRFQFLRSEITWIDCLTFFEFGYHPDTGFQFGPGVMIGKRWKYIEPYASYRFRHVNHKPEFFYLGENAHYLKFGNRFYIPCFWGTLEQRKMQWFIGGEVGPTFIKNETFLEWAVNLGFDY